MIFKCKNCGGNIVYNPEKKAMVCPFCETQDSYEQKESNTIVQTCPECGGEIQVDEFDSATRCPYCDNFIIFNERVTGEYLPKFVLPFQLGKEKCKELIRNKFKKMTFAPADFLSEVRLDSMQGVYVPFWLYNYKTRALFEGVGTKVRTWTSGSYRYTETSYYDVVRDMEIEFEKLPADASIKMPDDVMDLMEPYTYTKLEEFKPEYLSGFWAEYYNMPAEEIEGRAHQKMDDDASAILNGSITGYASLRKNVKTIQVLDRQTDYGLLPVWKYVYQYKDQDYPFYVNGETGKVIGKVPISNRKVLVYSASIWAFLTIIFTVLIRIGRFF